MKKTGVMDGKGNWSVVRTFLLSIGLARDRGRTACRCNLFFFSADDDDNELAPGGGSQTLVLRQRQARQTRHETRGLRLWHACPCLAGRHVWFLCLSGFGWALDRLRRLFANQTDSTVQCCACRPFIMAPEYSLGSWHDALLVCTGAQPLSHRNWVRLFQW